MIKNLNKKSQSWSLDIVLGVIIFFAAFVVFYTLVGSKPEAKVSDLKEEASVVLKQIVSDNKLYKIVDGNELNNSKLSNLKNISYDELKRNMRLQGDFCIYLEDEQGRIVLINSSYVGIGSPNINVSGVPCSQK